ncbi:MAG: response regulator [Deltaproteobacteria bacterium]|nr:response regulator [Deltaproteobacteria bacterium]
MAVITIFSASYCQSDVITSELSQRLGYRIIEDHKIIEKAGKLYDVAPGRFEKTLYHKTSIFNRFTHERERYVGYFKSIVAEYLKQDAIIFHGYAGHLIPKHISHVLKVCLIADPKYRVAQAVKAQRLSEDEALKRIHKDDEGRREWTEYVLRKAPWNPSLYDIVLPIDKTGLEDTIALIAGNARKGVVQPTDASVSAVKDFALASEVEVALAKEGHAVDVAAQSGKVTITINKHVIILSRLEEELKKIAKAVPGVSEVETRVGPDFYQPDIYRKFDFEAPSKVLLVDDEREFVQTLSERLLMRDVGSAVAYDGMQALSVIENDEPEVMILDLKMPGIDGIEVLRRVKAEHPRVEVIVLTGHGTAEDKKTCQELGAFAYLQKPVDIEVLTKTMNAAYEKLRRSKEKK